MEIILYGNKLKLENNEIYCYRKIFPNSKKIDWCKISFSIARGYLRSSLANNKKHRNVLLHRLMYLFYNPDFDILNEDILIDHIDRNKLNNSIDNLRIATPQQNMF
jgi:hypothetical protein